ncbi:two component transcriptional regulator, winged helix family [Desulfovibrio sp. X2]|uniref:response regulator transcription factor n=1 Tax=Desulfovibrio sp. X2 TaxID=941449 RepID=UPI000358E061|nr:response regulator transcription factor [Desulfovibrio sp. X2]EPR43445.1 two component transcriptional regulator, winged helix family [Desulfovibrio sp. X2]
MRILLVEDDAETAAAVSRGFLERGHAIDHAADGSAASRLIGADSYDVLVVDRMLPGLDGLTLVRRAREEGCRTPIIFLTTRSGIDDRVEGLHAGGDDYLVKPFAFAELLARVEALSRRPPLSDAATVLRVGDLEINIMARTAARSGRALGLNPLEFRLLEYLMRNAGQTVTRTMLLEHVWGFHFVPRTNVVETNISRLRAKVDRDFASELIHTVRGAGYCLHAPA